LDHSRISVFFSEMKSYCILSLLLVTFIPIAAYASGDLHCPTCNQSTCPPPKSECFAGMVKDQCNCCFICGNIEGERCYNETLRDYLPSTHQRFGFCGEDLECRLRSDMERSDHPEALCYCIKTEPLCGSDGVTYENECQLNEARYRKRDTEERLTTASRGPCPSAPRIVSPPEAMRNKSGSFIAFACEVMGWPVPSIEWRVQRDQGNTGPDPLPLPSDDSHIAVQTRGGPSNYEITGWLQVLAITSSDQGTYYCVAHNSQGEAQASARLVVTDAPSTSDDGEINADAENEVL